MSEMFTWWNSDTSNDFVKLYGVGAEDRIEEIRPYLSKAIHGIIPKQPKGGKLWLVYSLFSLDEPNESLQPTAFSGG